MKATITYSPPGLNSYQNVPHAECTTTNKKTKATNTKVRCVDVAVDSVQDDNGSYKHDEPLATESCRRQQWRHSHSHSHSRSHGKSHSETRCGTRADSMGANLRSNCCQREHKNYRKHVMAGQVPHCTRDDIPASVASERECRQAQYTRDYKVILAMQVKTSRRMKRTCEDYAIPSNSQFADASTLSDSIVCKSGSQERLSSNTATLSATSPTSWSSSTSPSFINTVSSLLVNTPTPCLEDNFSLSNKRQLVMPIEEENRLGNVAVGNQSISHETRTKARVLMTMYRTQKHPSSEMNKPPTQKQIQWRHRIFSRPTSASLMRVGIMEEAFGLLASTIKARKNALASGVAHINAAFSIAGAALLGNSQTTTTFDCRCFKENSDICMVANEKAKDGTNKEEEAEFNGLHECREVRGAVMECSGSRLASQQHRYPPGEFSFLAVLPLLLRKSLSSLGITGVPPWNTKLLVLSLLMITIASPANCWAGRSDVPTNCTFPARWEGSWFLSGYQQSIHIKGSQFSYRGKCAASDGNKYLIVDEKGCHRCLVIYEKHKNVLQYKESECEGDSMYMHQTNPSAMAMRSVLKQSEHRGGAHPNLNNNNGHSRLSSSDQYIMRSYDDMNDYFCKGRETLQNLCDQIPGDALLYSLFRESAEPVKCPLKGPYIFTYNRGHGECKSPVSNIESCTEDSRLLLSFQACPDVQGTESTVEELTCLAAWKDGNSRYLVGLVSHHHAISNEERYRCFVYEKISSLMGGPSIVSSKDTEYKLAQSGDATCNGLDSAEVGSRIMSLRKPPVTERCDFPAWFKGPQHWHVLMGNAVYNYHANDGSIHIIKPNGFMETRALCEQINKQTSTEMMAVVHYTTGCQSGFMCMMFYRRDTHVIEIQTGKQASRLEDACAPDHFDVNRMPFTTLLASNPDPQICPMEGVYNLRGAIGPPYLTTRHKRNHNKKLHTTHGHHHAQSELAIAAAVARGSESNNNHAHKRHATLSFRNTEQTESDSWQAIKSERTNRKRRDISIAPNNSSANVIGKTSTLEHLNILESQLQPQNSSIGGDLADPVGTVVALKTIDFIHPSTALNNDLQRLRNRRDAPGCITNYKAQRRLLVGCTEPDIINVRPLCNDDGDEEYLCHGSWSENGTVYIIARHNGTKHGVCLSYRPTEGTAAKLVIGEACYRGTQKPPDHHLVANLTVFGNCGETGSTAIQIRPSAELIHWGVAFYVLLLAVNLVTYVKNQR